MCEFRIILLPLAYVMPIFSGFLVALCICRLPALAAAGLMWLCLFVCVSVCVCVLLCLQNYL